MEPKKNPKYDVHQKRGIIFNISLVITLLIIITAFKWAIPVKTESNVPLKDLAPLEPLCVEKVVAYSPPKKIPSLPKPKVKAPDPNSFKAVSNTTSVPDKESIAVDPETMTTDTTVSLALIETAPPEDAMDIFTIVEEMPAPLGGYDEFYKVLRKNLRYPSIAKRSNIKGRVFVEFVINEKGELNEFKVLKGIGGGCDEEAMRVISLTKWKAGKQRGKPVRVRMVQPITFNLDGNN